MAHKGKKKRAQLLMPQTTGGWVLLVFLVLACLFWYYYPEIRELAYGPEEPDQTQQEAPSSGGEEKQSLTVHFLDVGQGDSILLLSGEETMLIDGSTRSAGDGVVEDLQELGVTHLDYLVASHSHEDHIGGLPDVLAAIPVEQAILSDDVADSKIYETFLTGLEEAEAEVLVPEAGETFSFGDCTVTVLGPTRVSEEHNENSLVLKVSCGPMDYLFTGDMEGEEEYDMIALGEALEAEILKVPHHGSEYTCNTEFLRQVQPQVAIISCGEGNSYGHPHEPLLDRLEEWELDVYRTDWNGRITCQTTVVNGEADTLITLEREG